VCSSDLYGPDGVDPYFAGAGPLRNGCDLRGACMTGCRQGAKNSLDRNYLWLAERAGAEIHPATEVRRLRASDTVSRARWELDTARGWFGARDVVLAAGVLGTLRILLRSGLGGPHVGDDVRTNSEVIMGASAPRVRRDVDYSRGVAITSSIRVGDTTIQPVRYGRGSNLMGALGTILVEEPGALRWAAAAVGHPVAFARSLWLRRWSERTVILLVMQSRESTLRVRLSRRGRLTTVESTAPAKIPVADEAARVAAELVGGSPGASMNEAILGTPMTAHILGGACVGTVVDRYHRVVAAPGLHVVDGAAVNANLGVNPSLTIAAQAERATALWPNRGEDDPRPPLGRNASAAPSNRRGSGAGRSDR